MSRIAVDDGIVLRAGRYLAGPRVWAGRLRRLSHLAGSDAVVDGLFAQYGLVPTGADRRLVHGHLSGFGDGTASAHVADLVAPGACDQLVCHALETYAQLDIVDVLSCSCSAAGRAEVALVEELGRALARPSQRSTGRQHCRAVRSPSRMTASPTRPLLRLSPTAETTPNALAAQARHHSGQAMLDRVGDRRAAGAAAHS
jgi:hypothetical protein